MKALYIASTGMAAQERNVEIISNNIANMRTTGYKRQRAEFQDLLYQPYRRAGSQTSDQGTQAPVGIEIGSGVKTAATPRIMTPGHRHADRKGSRRRGQRRRLLRRAAARRPHRLHPRRLVRARRPTACSSTSTATRCSPASPIPENANSLVDQRRRHRPGLHRHRQRPDPARPDPALPLRQQGRPRIRRRQQLRRDRRERRAAGRRAQHRRHRQRAAGLSRSRPTSTR